MIIIKNKSSILKMKQAGKLLSEIFEELPSLIKLSIDTLSINNWIADQLKNKGLVSRSKGYMGYKYESCISINDEVIHGVPSAEKILKEGDLVKIDICASYKGYCGDMARSFFVGQPPSVEAKKLVDVAQYALNAGISMAKAGNHVSDISAAIQRVVEDNGFGIIRDFAGHGLGKNLHEAPEIPNCGKPGKGPVLMPGMALAIEPMITAGGHKVFVDDKDGWTVKTVDKSLAAHIEDTIIVTDIEPDIITRKQD